MNNSGFSIPLVHNAVGIMTPFLLAATGGLFTELAGMLNIALEGLTVIGGVFSVVLECIPSQISAIITEQLAIPTIGIGAGERCDGQVLVTHDLLGLFDRFKPKFIKQYTDISTPIIESVRHFCQEVEEGKFPDQLHSYSMNSEELANLKVEK